MAKAEPPPPTEFMKQFHILSNAGVGVTMIPTKEVNMTLTALRRYSLEKGFDFKFWTHVVGWESLPKAGAAVPERDREFGLYEALKLIGDVDNDGKNAWPKSHTRGIYVMVYPHWGMKQLPAFMQCVKDYVYAFSSGGKARLVLIVPEDTTLPIELQNDLTLLEYGLPDKEQIREIFNRTIPSLFKAKGVECPFTADDVHQCVNLAAGMTEMEAENGFSRAIAAFRPYGVKKETDDYSWLKTVDIRVFVQSINMVKTEAIKRSQCLTLMPEVRVEDVAGLELAKLWVEQRSAAFNPDAPEFGVDRPRGMLMVGPPGTGKSLFSKMIGAMFKQRVVRLDMGAVFNKYVGASEERIREVIKMAKAMAPVTLLIDEVDKAGGGPKDGGTNEASARVMSTLLTEMQECDKEVFWVFTANWPDRIDPALLRKGRLDAIFSVLAPTKIEREAVLKLHLRKRKQKIDQLNMPLIIEAMKGFVSAEIEAIVADAVIEAYHGGKKPVTTELLLKCAGETKPLSHAFPEEFLKMETWAKNHAKPSSTPDEVIAIQNEQPTQRTRDV